jgi:cytochrome c-type biogenesis protein CcmE
MSQLESSLGTTLAVPKGRAPTGEHMGAQVGGRSSRRAVIQLAIGMLVILAAIGFLAYQGLSNNLVYYITPSELLAKGRAADGQQLRLGGQVRPGSQRYSSGKHIFRFVLQDPKASVPVVSSDMPPPLFASGNGAVVQGTYRNGVFHATLIMVKHSSAYVAPKPGQYPKNNNYVKK